jgi:predicted membrane chloride channel (bestrophin family)
VRRRQARTLDEPGPPLSRDRARPLPALPSLSKPAYLLSPPSQFRHSVAYQRFWDAKQQISFVLCASRNTAMAFRKAPFRHRREAAGLIAAMFDCLTRRLVQDLPTDAALFERSPAGPWKQAALSALSPKLVHLLIRMPAASVQAVACELLNSAAFEGLRENQAMVVHTEVLALCHSANQAISLSATPVPPLYTVLLAFMIHAFTAALSLLTGLSLVKHRNIAAWIFASATVGLIYLVFSLFYLAAKELAEPFRGRLQVPMRMYEAALLHDIYTLLEPFASEEVVEHNGSLGMSLSVSTSDAARRRSSAERAAAGAASSYLSGSEGTLKNVAVHIGSNGAGAHGPVAVAPAPSAADVELAAVIDDLPGGSVV